MNNNIIMIIFIILILSSLGCYIYYNSVKDMYQNNDINEFLLSSDSEDNEDINN